MKAVVISEAGSAQNLEYRDVPTPKVKKGWSLVKVKGFGINHSEIFTREGQSPSVVFPRILGIECVGVIEQTTDALRLPIGQKVVSIMGEMGRAFDGSYAEYVLLPNDQIYPIETKLEWDVLASIPETYYTAYGSFRSLDITDKDEVLVRGATSSLGIAFMKIVKGLYPSVTVTGTTRRLHKAERLRQQGFDDVIVDQDGKLQTNKVYTKIIDLVGPKSIKNSISHLAQYGTICSVGQLGNEWYLNTFDPIIELRGFKKLTSFYSGDVDIQLLNHIIRLIEKGHISNVGPVKVFGLNQIVEAHEYVENEQESFGKVVVIP
ncbi:zinc-binding dehydrogenase [Staphylococcus felis]|uniref:zinc-binding dehydrogenase n=1 Tax=Staphylococcus felis TaxID=46127 RepID=UPI000CD2ECB6|nr:zinc-binding dehydrogenase [Staphylococcus felis]AVP36047.1 quinone oxidoreductase [Staphylococcus felis]PNZ36483.1 quinone oxidoreductase [Staphylococcus felis]QQB03984.1 zinc-binding dehydrogenase [Staphylococcus felis]